MFDRIKKAYEFVQFGMQINQIHVCVCVCVGIATMNNRKNMIYIHMKTWFFILPKKLFAIIPKITSDEIYIKLDVPAIPICQWKSGDI